MTDPDQDIEIAGSRVSPGATKQLRIDIARLPTGTIIDVPIHVIRGKESGPTLLMQGGLHGDEVGGIEVLRRMLQDKLIKPLAGTVIVIPILNVFGFIHFSRDVPDGKDINRSFPGTQRGSLASRVAWTFMNELFPLIDYGLDFHTGGRQRHNYPQVRYAPEDKGALELAQAFAAPFILPSKLIPKSFRKEANKRGVPVVVYEAGESLRFDEFAISQGIAGSLRVMEHLGMTKKNKAVPERDAVLLSTSRWVRANRAGLFHVAVENGAQVSKGQILGTLSDAFGGHRTTLRAPWDGWVLCVNNHPVANRGDALFRVGRS